MYRNYEIIKALYTGKFSSVFYGIVDSKKVIIKQFNNIDLYNNEKYIYKQLASLNNIPKMYDSFKKNKIYSLVLQDVGIDLLTFKKIYYDNNDYLKYVKYFTIELISVIEDIHSIYILHRDIKPANICIKNSKIYIIDFGYSYRYKYKNKHIVNNKINNVIGSYNYISENVLNLNTPSRRDDIESVIYVLIFLLISKNNYKKYNRVDYQIKKTQNIICKILNKYFINIEELIFYIKNLNFIDTPNYIYIKQFIYINLNLNLKRY